MKLSQLIFYNDAEYLSSEAGALEISSVCCDSRKTEAGSAFFLLSGEECYAREAISKGAVAVISETETDARLPAALVIVKNVREAFSLACLRFYGNPHKKLRLCAVTGTNGKTTVAHMLSAILKEAGYDTALIGTLGANIGSGTYQTDYTTPPSDVLAKLLSEAVKEKADFVIMEASSHALAQKRLFGLEFEVGIFTNLSHDHLDYHKTRESCALAKASLFKQCKNSVINFDDAYSHEMAWNAKDIIWYYSATDYDADYYADNILLDENGSHFGFATSGLREQVDSPLHGMFAVYDMLAAASATAALGVRRKLIARALGKFQGVSGRMEKTTLPSGVSAVIDFAHTPEAMKSALSAARTFTKGKLICVFGCGGERDRTKRAEMGKLASELSDFIIVTSDNPRGENPAAIILDILCGIPDGTNFSIIENRGEAIHYAINSAEKGDTVMLLGKGHEKYIEALGEKIPFSDREEIDNIIKEKGM